MINDLGRLERWLPWAQIHFCVMLWGFTAILGKLISLPALALVEWRMALVSALLYCFPRVWRGIGRMSWRLRGIYAGIGALVCVHWVSFFLAVKLANASVAATCMALTPVFMSLIEPWLTSRAFDRRELILGLAVVPGIAMVVGGTAPDMHIGIAIGCFSALCATSFGALNKRFLDSADVFAISAVEMLAGAILLAVISIFLPHADSGFAIPTQQDLLYLMALAWACTFVPFVLSLTAMRHISAFGVVLAVNLEPIYTILLAIGLFHEQHELGIYFYIGVALILAAVFIYPWYSYRRAVTSHI